MQFLKQIKVKAFGNRFFENKEQQQTKRQQLQFTKNKQKNNNVSGNTLKSFSKIFFSQNKQQAREEKQNISRFDGQKRFWNVTSPIQPVTTSKTLIHQTNTKQTVEYIIDSQSAAIFICNLQQSVADLLRQNKMKVSKAKNQIFGNLQVEPIYMSQNCEKRILTMELQQRNQEMIERTQQLVLQKNILDRTIENALICGYLWRANDLQNYPFVQSCFSVLNDYNNTIISLYQRVKQARQKLQLILPYLKKVNNLNKKRIIIAKKLNLLKKIRSYKKDTEQKFKNIDEAFYIQRNRQKLHTHFILNQNTVAKVNLLRVMIGNIRIQNQKMKQLIQKQLVDWIDNQKQLQKKHIQKLLILLYFTKNQKMYYDYGLQVNESKIIKNNAKFIEEITKVKNWEDFKYVNDKRVKQNVNQFLNTLIKQLSRNASQKQNSSKQPQKDLTLDNKINYELT